MKSLEKFFRDIMFSGILLICFSIIANKIYMHFTTDRYDFIALVVGAFIASIASVGYLAIVIINIILESKSKCKNKIL